MSKNPSKKTFFIFTLAATIFGFVTGILTAPKSGKETRQDIKNKAEEVKAESVEQLRKVEVELKDAIAEVKLKASSLGNRAKSEYDEASDKAAQAQTKASQVLKAVKSGDAEDEDLDAALKQAKEAIKNLSKFLKS